MLRISLEKLVSLVEKESVQPLTIAAIAEGTGIHRNIISRILNRPGASTATSHIDKLLQFFLEERRKYSDKPDRELIAELIAAMFEFFPEDGPYQEILARLNKAGDISGLPIPVLWEFHALAQGSALESGGTLDDEWRHRESTKNKLRSGPAAKKRKRRS